MTWDQFLLITKSVLKDSRSGIFATAGSAGKPVMRWMTPVFLDDRTDCLYAVTSGSSYKASELKENVFAQWMFFTRTYDRIITLDCSVKLKNDRELIRNVMENLGDTLRPFWMQEYKPSTVVIIETVITGGMIYSPLKSTREFSAPGK